MIVLFEVDIMLIAHEVKLVLVLLEVKEVIEVVPSSTSQPLIIILKVNKVALAVIHLQVHKVTLPLPSMRSNS